MKFENLIATRKTMGLSQQKMASLANMEQTTYSRKERGLSPIRNDEWEKFAKILSVPIDEIKEHQFISNNMSSIFLKNKENPYVSIPRELYEFMMSTISKIDIIDKS